MVGCDLLKPVQANGHADGTVPASPASTPLGTPTIPAAQPVGWDCTNWDLNTQQPHGGQEWSSLDNFLEDFSVTTNVLGPPWRAVTAAAASLQHVDHYPAANFEPCLTELAQWLSPDKAQ